MPGWVHDIPVYLVVHVPSDGRKKADGWHPGFTSKITVILITWVTIRLFLYVVNSTGTSDLLKLKKQMESLRRIDADRRFSTELGAPLAIQPTHAALANHHYAASLV